MPVTSGMGNNFMLKKQPGDPSNPLVPPPVMPSLTVPGSSSNFDTWMQGQGPSTVPPPVQPGTPLLPPPPAYSQPIKPGTAQMGPDAGPPPDITGGTLLPPTSGTPIAGPPTPQANMPNRGIQSQQEYFASNPDQEAKPLLQGRSLGRALLTGLAAAGMGWGGNPAGPRYLEGIEQHDLNIPEINAQRYQEGYLKPTLQTMPVQVPGGESLPAGLAKTVLGPLYGYQGKVQSAQIGADAKTTAAQTAAGAKVQSAQIGARYKETPGGLYDTQTGNVIQGTAGAITITPDIAQSYGLGDAWVGQPMKLSQLTALKGQQLEAAPTVGSSTDSLGITTTSRHQKVLPGQPGGMPASAASPAPAPAGVPSGAPAFGGPPKATAPSGGAAPAGSILDRQAQQLVDGNMSPSQVPKRGAAYQILMDKANAYSQQKYGKPFDLAQAGTDYKFAQEPQTQNTLKYLNSLTGPDNKSGNLASLVDLSNKLGRTQFPAVNDVAAWGRIQTGNTQMTNYHTLAVEVADQVGKILQGGGGSSTSDTKLKQAVDLFNTGFSADQISGIADTLRGALANRKSGLIGNNSYLQRQFGGAAPSSAQGKTINYKIVNGQLVAQ